MRDRAGHRKSFVFLFHVLIGQYQYDNMFSGQLSTFSHQLHLANITWMVGIIWPTTSWRDEYGLRHLHSVRMFEVDRRMARWAVQAMVCARNSGLSKARLRDDYVNIFADNFSIRIVSLIADANKGPRMLSLYDQPTDYIGSRLLYS